MLNKEESRELCKDEEKFDHDESSRLLDHIANQEKMKATNSNIQTKDFESVELERSPEEAKLFLLD